MDKELAIELMMQGKKVTHNHFSIDEWMTMDNGKIILEDGVKCDPQEFWRWRTDESWNKGYQVWQERPKQPSFAKVRGI